METRTNGGTGSRWVVTGLVGRVLNRHIEVESPGEIYVRKGGQKA